MSCRISFMVSAWILCSVSAWGAFMDGVESFDGAIKDTATWEEFVYYQSASIEQDDAISISANPGFTLFEADYTTKNITIGPGDSVSVEILMHVDSSASRHGAYLALTTNEWGTQRGTISDSHFLFARFDGRSDEPRGSIVFGEGAVDVDCLRPGFASTSQVEDPTLVEGQRAWLRHVIRGPCACDGQGVAARARARRRAMGGGRCPGLS